MIIGVDFDNTIVDYDEVFFRRAAETGLIEQGASLSKRRVRDLIRSFPGGESSWQGLQAYAYTTGMAGALLIDGVRDFFASCRRAGVPVYIVSHKTAYPPAAFEQVDLRASAMNWMKNHAFFDESGLGLEQGRVFFETTRAEKIARIGTLKCTHFIDDLEEVLLDDAFPSGIRKILYSPETRPAPKDVIVAGSWRNIHEQLLG